MGVIDDEIAVILHGESSVWMPTGPSVPHRMASRVEGNDIAVHTHDEVGCNRAAERGAPQYLRAGRQHDFPGAGDGQREPVIAGDDRPTSMQWLFRVHDAATGWWRAWLVDAEQVG